MNEEEIILLKDFKDGKIEKDKLENYAKGGFKLGYFYTKDIQQAIEKVLNELEKKDTQIKNQSYTNKKMRKKLDGYRKLLKLKERHLLKKDKIINSMFHEYEYNARINIKNYCDDEIRKDTCIQDCENCIKQYFEKEVKDE